MPRLLERAVPHQPSRPQSSEDESDSAGLRCLRTLHGALCSSPSAAGRLLRALGPLPGTGRVMSLLLRVLPRSGARMVAPQGTRRAQDPTPPLAELHAGAPGQPNVAEIGPKLADDPNLADSRLARGRWLELVGAGPKTRSKSRPKIGRCRATALSNSGTKIWPRLPELGPSLPEFVPLRGNRPDFGR